MCWQSRKGRHRCNSFQNKLSKEVLLFAKKLVMIFRISHTCVGSINNTIFLKTLMFRASQNIGATMFNHHRSYNDQQSSELQSPLSSKLHLLMASKKIRATMTNGQTVRWTTKLSPGEAGYLLVIMMILIIMMVVKILAI